jgi:hypothetical protein
MRIVTNVSFVLLDEADFFPLGQQQSDTREFSERHTAKLKPYILMIRTPNAPGGLFETIDNENSLYKLDYTYHIDNIQTKEE